MRERKQYPAGWWILPTAILGGIAWYFIMVGIAHLIGSLL